MTENIQIKELSKIIGGKVRDFSESPYIRGGRRGSNVLLIPLLSASLAFLLVVSPAYAGAGSGFGESMRMYGAAAQAGTGGLPLERFANSDSEVFTQQSYMDAGVRWVGMGLEVGMFSVIRIGFEGVMVSADGVDQTVEQIDGSYSGSTGKMSASETALRGSLQWDFGGRPFSVSARMEMQGVSQDIAGDKGSGIGTTGMLFGRYGLNESWNLLGWVSGGPYGQGHGSDFVSSVTGGAGVEHPGGLGLIGGSEGFRLGAEYEMTPGDQASTGGGLVYWFGGRDIAGTGVRLAIRAGFRGEPGSVAPSQGRFGVGVTFRDDLGVGWGADYGFVPFGNLGTVHYLSARIKLGLGFFRHADDTKGEYGGGGR